MARWSEATWRPVKNHGGAMAAGRPITVTMHHAVMNGSLYNVFNGSRQASTHFLIFKDGRCEQYVDTSVVSWGGVNHNAYSISVETEGCASPPHAEPMTDAMVNTFARLYAWAHRTHGIPYRLSESVSEPGFNYHRVRDAGVATACPCDVRKNMRGEILRRAQGGAAPSPPATEPEDENMIASAVSPSGSQHVFVATPDAIFVTWQDSKTRKWVGEGKGYMAGLQHFAKAPGGQKIAAINAVISQGVFHVYARARDGSSWVTWQGAGGKWNGGGSGWHAGLAHFAAKP